MSSSNTLESKCGICGEMWQLDTSRSFGNNCSIEKIVDNRITVKWCSNGESSMYSTYENVCNQCTINRAKEDGVPGSEDIHKEGHSYVKNQCICNDETHMSTRGCFRCKQSFEELTAMSERVSSCRAFDVKNSNGRVNESPHYSHIAICGGPPPYMCSKCDEHYEVAVESGGGMFSTYCVKERVAQ